MEAPIYLLVLVRLLSIITRVMYRHMVLIPLSVVAGGQICRECVPQGGVMDIVLTPDGRRVVSLGDDRWARIWDCQTASLVTSFCTVSSAGAPLKVSRHALAFFKSCISLLFACILPNLRKSAAMCLTQSTDLGE